MNNFDINHKSFISRNGAIPLILLPIIIVAWWLLWFLFKFNIDLIGVGVTYTGVVVALWIYSANTYETDMREIKHQKDLYLKEIESQKDLLRSILVMLDFLAGDGKRMILGKESGISHINWLEESLKKNEAPAHPILEIDADFFAKNLDSDIDGRSTTELKAALYFIRDKCIMINQWLPYFWAHPKELKGKNRKLIEPTGFKERVSDIVNEIKKFNV